MQIPTIKPAIFSAHAGVVCGMSTRIGGVSGDVLGMNLSFNVGDDEQNVRINRERFFSALGADVESGAFAGQVHSARVRDADGPGMHKECDGLVTNRAGVYLAISVADCVPILLYDPIGRAAAALHAGWRGTDAGIVANGIKMLKEQFNSQPEDLLAFIGPAAGECCYEVGEEVSSRFESRFVRELGGRLTLDLKSVNKQHLMNEGLREENIEVNPLCTITEKGLLHSYRRDGYASGRMLAVIGIRP